MTVAVKRASAASDGPEARTRCETHRALRAGAETPARRCVPETSRRAGAACAAIAANVALDVDAMPLGYEGTLACHDDQMRDIAPAAPRRDDRALKIFRPEDLVSNEKRGTRSSWL